jgi:chromosome segregation ATPase
MCKKATIGVIGLLVLAALLFGGRLIPYAQTAAEKIRNSAQDSVPISFQIDAARKQLKKIDPEIKDMVWQIAKEKSAIKRLSGELEAQAKTLEKSYSEMMTLREHLNSGEEFYVSVKGDQYANTRVKEDLRHRLSVYQTAEKTKEKSGQILELRQQALESAMAKLEEAQAQKRELEVQVENLLARQRMVEVAKTATKNIEINDSQLALTREMIEEISAKIDAEEEMLNLAPKYLGQIPVSPDSEVNTADVVQEFDEYFGRTGEDDDVVRN